MLIDWFTVGAQALNFVILVWLMKRFLYRPILNAIDAREQRIAAELATARARQAEADKEHAAYQERNEQFDQQRAKLLQEATDAAAAERQRLLEAARQAADTLRAKRLETLRNEAHNLDQAIGRRARQEVFAIARQALADLATTSLEASLAEVFTRRLRELDAAAQNDLGEALKAATTPALVRSAFALPEEQRAAIRQALNETFAADIQVRFATAPELVSGIELSAHGRKLAWSIADYLAALEKDVEAMLDEQDKSAAGTGPEPAAASTAEPAPEDS
jgi:F-type H+-transporting ATPase subunit b